MLLEQCTQCFVHPRITYHACLVRMRRHTGGGRLRASAGGRRPGRLSDHARPSAAQARSGGPRQGTAPQRWPDSRRKGKWPDGLGTETPFRAIALARFMRTPWCNTWTKGGPPAQRGSLCGGAMVHRPLRVARRTRESPQTRPGKTPWKERRTNRTTGSLRSASAKAEEAGFTRDMARTQGDNLRHECVLCDACTMLVHCVHRPASNCPRGVGGSATRKDTPALAPPTRPMRVNLRLADAMAWHVFWRAHVPRPRAKVRRQGRGALVAAVRR